MGLWDENSSREKSCARSTLIIGIYKVNREVEGKGVSNFYHHIYEFTTNIFILCGYFVVFKSPFKSTPFKSHEVQKQ